MTLHYISVRFVGGLLLALLAGSCASVNQGTKPAAEPTKNKGKLYASADKSRPAPEEPAVGQVQKFQLKKPANHPAAQEPIPKENLYSVNFREIKLGSVIRMLSDGGKNFRYILYPDAAGRKVSDLKLEGITWREALDVVIRLYNLTEEKKNGLIIINTRDGFVKDKEFEAQRAKLRFAGMRRSRSFRLKYTQPDEVKKYLGKMFREENRYGGGKSGSASNSRTDLGNITFSVFPKASMITAYGPQSMLDEVEKRIAEIDVPQKQIFIESRIVDISRNHSRSLGIQWGGYHNASNQFPYSGSVNLSGSADTASDATFGYIVNQPATDQTQSGVISTALNIAVQDITGTKLLNMRLSALERAGKSKTLSNPKVTTINGVKAKIESGREIPYQTTSQYGTQTQFKKAVISLEVTPFITPDNRINLKIIAKKQDADFINQVQDVPSILTRTIETNIVVSDGGTAVLGGLFENVKTNSDTGTPGLSRIPIIGWLFKSNDKTDNEKEFLIFITPKIIDGNIS
ncbi:MAG: hypothetical protein IEMM0002_0011 [bacterium]|nr:MAG: hypothetical protein IEMM0002_0011 [bacterium]